MPSYHVHSVVGLLSAVLAVVVASILFVASAPVLAALFFTMSFSAVMADVDSPTSTPFHVASTIGSLLIAGAGTAIAFRFAKGLAPWHYAAVPVGLFVAAKVVLFGIARRLTEHRGAWHSVPAAVICGLLGLYAANRAGLGPDVATAVGGGLLLGYLLHLILDEGGSLLQFRFIFFWKPARSLGSALKWHGDNAVSTSLMYGAIVTLVILDFPLLKELLNQVR